MKGCALLVALVAVLSPLVCDAQQQPLTDPQRIGIVSGVILLIALVAAVLLVLLSVVECASGGSSTRSNA
ncbi:hypothetical protein EMCRGX_G011292 [Ephydatia muelleri]|eukprot:Em0006g979a